MNIAYIISITSLGIVLYLIVVLKSLYTAFFKPFYYTNFLICPHYKLLPLSCPILDYFKHLYNHPKALIYIFIQKNINMPIHFLNK